MLPLDYCLLSLSHSFGDLQNGTKESISKLVTDLNGAKLEDDVGKITR